MKKLLKILIMVFVLFVIIVPMGCSTSTDARSPANGEWDNVEIWNGGNLVFKNYDGGTVTIKTTETKNHSACSSDGTTWVEWVITYKGDAIYVLDISAIVVVYWNN